MTPSRRKPARPAGHPAPTPLIPGPRSGERDVPETADPYDLPFPDHWPPGRALDRNSAITAMTLAGHAGQGDLNEQHQIWPFIESWAAELGLTGSDAITRASSGGPGQQHDRESEPPDLEAGQ